ncbi:hypothetical protein [Glutamicibacter arilaitensis]|uniref:hypothetical protein n=1 Tax=Glutamicibacter arilaitensis TaxID=256701 RepID=UPI003FCFBF24
MAVLPRELEANENSLFQRMLSVIRHRSRRNLMRRNLHDAKEKLDKVGFSVPPHMVDFQTPLGWAEKAVSVPAARIRREGFRMLGESSLADDLELIFEDRHNRRLEAGATKSSLKHGPAFVFVTRGDVEKGEPEVVFSAKSALEATCIQDPRTGIVRAALELVGRNKALLYLPGMVLSVDKGGANGWKVTAEYPQAHQLVLCEPQIWDWDLDRPFGRSRITRPLIGSIHQGVRTLLLSDVTAEFFSRPQRALMGASEEHFTDKDGNPLDIWKMITGSIWALPDVWDDDEGKLVRPKLEQLQQASMQPHNDMFKGVALRVASETSLPIGYLGVQENQPASADAIRAAEADMISLIEHQIEISYKLSSLNLARKALAVLHDGLPDSMLADLRGLSVRFLDPGTPTVAARSDAALKYTQAFPNGDPQVAMELYGLSEDQIKRNLEYMRRNQSNSLVQELIKRNASTQPETPATPATPATAEPAGQATGGAGQGAS